MERILGKRGWFQPLASVALLEVEYERCIFQHAHALFPDFHAVEFKMSVASEAGTAKADYALIDRAYRTWWVVEVELIHHSLDSHVLPQVDVLANALYGDECAQWLAAREACLDPTRLKRLMKGLQPRILLIANGSHDRWVSDLSPYGALMLSIEIFRSDLNRELLVVDGELPSLPADFISRCRPNRSFLNFLEVESPAAIVPDENGHVQIAYQGFVSEWSFVEAQDGVWLRPVRQSPFSNSKVKELRLIRDGNGTLVFEDITNRPYRERKAYA